MTRTSLGPFKFVSDICISSHFPVATQRPNDVFGTMSFWCCVPAGLVLVIATSHAANGDNWRMPFRASINEWYFECTYKDRPKGACLLTTHNIHYSDKIRTFPKRSLDICLFLNYRKFYSGTTSNQSRQTINVFRVIVFYCNKLND